MAASSLWVSQIIEPILDIKGHELERHRVKFNTLKEQLLSSLETGDIQGRLSKLFDAVNEYCEPDISSDRRINIVEAWRQGVNVDSTTMNRLKTYEKILLSKLQVQKTSDDCVKMYVMRIFADNEALEILGDLRSYIQEHELSLRKSSALVDQVVVRSCIGGLLTEGHLTHEKERVLRALLRNPTTLDEIADNISTQLDNLYRWSWGVDEEDMQAQRTQTLIQENTDITSGNRKLHVRRDEDVLQAIFIYYVSSKNWSVVNNAFGTALFCFQSKVKEKMTSRLKHELFSNSSLKGAPTLDEYRVYLSRAHLPSPKTSIPESEICKNGANSGKGNFQDELKKQSESDENRYLRTLAAEVVVHRAFYDEVAVVQASFSHIISKLPHTTILSVISCLGFSGPMVSFYQKVLSAPLSNVFAPKKVISPQRGMLLNQVTKTLLGEIVLFALDFSVKSATGLVFYRMGRDFFVCGKPSLCARAWEKIKEFAGTMGIELSIKTSGSVYMISPNKKRDKNIEAALPKGAVHCGMLMLDQDTGEWIPDQSQIDARIARDSKRLAACNSILRWVEIYNESIDQFYSRLGVPAYSLGLKHVMNIMSMYRRILPGLLQQSSHSYSNQDDQNVFEGTILAHLKEKIRRVTTERRCYDRVRKATEKLDATQAKRRFHFLYPSDNERKTVSSSLPGLTSFMLSYEEYTQHREWTSPLLQKTYEKLLDGPFWKDIELRFNFEKPVTEKLLNAGISTWAEFLQLKWMETECKKELEDYCGGSYTIVDKKYLLWRVLATLRALEEDEAEHRKPLSSIPITDNVVVANNPISSHRSSNQPTNPLRLIPPAYRTLLTTLHVLYPSTLLPALDLLDRRLVTRVVLKGDVADHSRHTQAGHNLTTPQDEESQGDIEQTPTPLYHLVRSAQPQSHRRQNASSAGGQVYIVRLESWNCTCAAFAFSAFPPLSAPVFPPGSGQCSAGGYQIHPANAQGDAKGRGADVASGDDDAAEQMWEFGGLSTDGKDGVGGVPCCKHILACVLAEKWGEVLGGYIEERLVGREEAAGLVSDL
ncbi:hypothetical protein F5B22DRAFT_654185 [Xylaria bambusicola]|uniref:uncharacterized protein n=1 Tax=Xylaria bambusicola TaxID=326684 RepID=UPI0020079A89|nr:uncharacterized protein F5B22DRAFT_654185 [Xylaria bambusicola]KAI0518281.1 hypothetical protein F5B22DRAFT_654185 [Xylaria bambusicola]